MKNKQIKNKVLNDIKRSKLQAEAVANNNLEKAMQDDNFKNLYLQIKSLNFSIAKKEFLNQPTAQDKNALSKLKKEIEQFNRMLEMLEDDDDVQEVYHNVEGLNE